MVAYGAPKQMYYPVFSPELVAMFSKCYVYIRKSYFIYTASTQNEKNNNISWKFIMLTDNNKIFRNLFVIIHRHLTKVSAQVIQCIIFERNEVSIRLSTLWHDSPLGSFCYSWMSLQFEFTRLRSGYYIITAMLLRPLWLNINSILNKLAAL